MATKQKQERMVIGEQSRDDVAGHLQDCLANLIDLALQCKQAHWNLVGRRFHSFHKQLDEIVDAARNGSDEVAERIATLGLAADGRAETVHNQSGLESFPEGRIHVDHAVTLIADRLETAIQRLRAGIKATSDSDPISQDLLIGISGELEKHLWMVQSQEEE
jgi:starvation-inducible DNA-binding protein